MPVNVVPPDKNLFDGVPEQIARDWILSRQSLPFRSLPGMDEALWLKYHLDELRTLHCKKEAVTFLAADVPCVVLARHLPWDTRVLGIPSAIIEHVIFSDDARVSAVGSALNRACDYFRDYGVRLLVHKTSPANVSELAVLGGAGFDLLCIHLDFLGDVSKAAALSPPLEGYEFGPARPDEADSVARIASENYARMDRFNIDPIIPRDRIASVYWEWAQNAFRGYVDLVWVARREGRVVGFIFWAEQKKLAAMTGVRSTVLQLVAVDAQERSRGIFHGMNGNALAYLHEQGIQWATSPTNIRNYSFQHSVRKLDWIVYDSVLTYRKDLSTNR